MRAKTTHDPPRILIDLADDARRAALATALRDTGYVVAESTDDAPRDDGYDLVVADGHRPVDGPIPTLLVPEPFDVVEIEMSILDLLAWDGPPTLRRVPLWAWT